MERQDVQSGGERLQALAAMIPAGLRVADIGTDHGLLPRLLLQTGQAAHCIACDVSPVAMAALESRIPAGSMPANLELRTGDGLVPLLPADRLDALVLAGIGAVNQCRILDSPRLADLGVRRLVLQPQGDAVFLRRWLTRKRFRIVDESLILERGTWHLTLAAEPGHLPVLLPHPALSDEDLMAVGPCLVRSGGENVREYWEFQAGRLKKVASGAPVSPGRDIATRELEQTSRILAALPPSQP